MADKNIRAADGGYLLDDSQFYYTKDELRRPVLHIKSGGKGDFMADGSKPMTGDLQMDGNAIFGVNSISNADNSMAIESNVSMNNHTISDLAEPVNDNDAVRKVDLDKKIDAGDVTQDIDMSGHAIENAQKVHVDGVASVYIGSTIEPEGTSGVRMTATTDGEAAFVKPDKQSEYAAVNVANPTKATHAVNKGYADGTYLPLSGGTLGAMAQIRASSLMTLTADDKADVTLTDNGVIFISGKMAVHLMADNDGVTISVNKDGLSCGNNKIVKVAMPTEDTDVAIKKYVDEAVAKVLPTPTEDDDKKALVWKDGKLMWGTANDIQLGIDI